MLTSRRLLHFITLISSYFGAAYTLLFISTRIPPCYRRRLSRRHILRRHTPFTIDMVTLDLLIIVILPLFHCRHRIFADAISFAVCRCWSSYDCFMPPRRLAAFVLPYASIYYISRRHCIFALREMSRAAACFILIFFTFVSLFISMPVSALLPFCFLIRYADICYHMLLRVCHAAADTLLPALFCCFSIFAP